MQRSNMSHNFALVYLLDHRRCWIMWSRIWQAGKLIRFSLNSQISFFDMVIVQKFIACAGKGYTPVFQNVSAVAH